MPFNIVNSLNLINDKLASSTPAFDKVSALDHMIQALNSIKADFNLMDQNLGGVGGFASIDLAVADIAALLGPLNPNSFITSGTYLPVATPVANVTAFANVFDAQWIRVRNVVNVSGVMRVTPTAITTLTGWSLTLPFVTDLTAVINLAGSFVCDHADMTPTTVLGTGGVAGQAGFTAQSVLNVSTLLTYTYQFTVV